MFRRPTDNILSSLKEEAEYWDDQIKMIDAMYENTPVYFLWKRKSLLKQREDILDIANDCWREYTDMYRILKEA